MTIARDRAPLGTELLRLATQCPARERQIRGLAAAPLEPLSATLDECARW